ncbi:hypothetical protein DRE_04579 [Drechslerella stenobrocha 248]|uniref:Secreted protein n=1 Tax=Drechslerella stenobrocha 248 TaxID=1043628 RepID=W7HPX5_9PEZI|nr:hypothetical protein DRE_04579 [Drechslerella stenobrocha 248]
MKFSASFLATSLVALVAAAPPMEAPSGATPPPGSVTIKGITYGGSGCPGGSVGQAISSDRTLFTLIFDQYVASSGKGVPATESRKNCQLNIQLQYPGGWQYSIFSATYRGFASIPKGLVGTQKSTYYFSGDTRQFSGESNLYGPINKDYVYTDNVENTSNVWSPCGTEGYLNINSQVRITGDLSQSALLTTDSIDGKFTQVCYLKWQKC